VKTGRLLSVGLLLVVSGCGLAPHAEFVALQDQNRMLLEQKRALLSQVSALETHSRNTANRLKLAEEDLALMEEQIGLDDRQLANFRRERAELHRQFTNLATGQATLSPEMNRRLTILSERYPSLHFDPNTGISKLDMDILFSSGYSDVRPEAQRILSELTQVLNEPEGSDLRVMVVGHTDDQAIAKKPAREKFPNNFHLSTSRALAVADCLRQQGLDDNRIGIAGFGAHQPVASNTTDQDRRKNRRVEIFVMSDDVPVVGWTETMPTLY